MSSNPYPAYGTFTNLDLLATNFQSIAAIGENNAWDAVAAAVVAHNRQVDEITSDLVEVTTDRERVYGTAQLMGFDEIDEFGTPDVQKVSPGQLVGFPLRKYGAALQWTRDALENMTGAEMRGHVMSMLDGDKLNVLRRLKQAIFGATNYTFIDRLQNYVNQIPLPVKAFVNADSAGLPVGPNGEVFVGSSHTHYMGVASANTPVAADLDAALTNLLEHYTTGKAVIRINQAQEAAVRAYTNFVQMYDNTISIGANVTYATGPLDKVQVYNRMIGTYRGAEVWVKPWMPAGYWFLSLEGAPKPLVWRKPSVVGGNQTMADGLPPSSLRLIFEDESRPLRSKSYERKFGVGVWNRTNGVVVDTTHTSYTAPVL